LEIKAELDRIVEAWQAGQTYTDLPWIVQVAMLVREACSNGLSAYELERGDIKYRQELANKVITATKQSTNSSMSNLRDARCLSLTKLLQSCSNFEYRQKDDLEISMEILEPFWGSQQGSNSNIPYLIAIWKTLELSQSPENYQPNELAKCVIQLTRNQTNHPLFYVTDLNSFVFQIVNETAENCLSILASCRSSEREENPISVSGNQMVGVDKVIQQFPTIELETSVPRLEKSIMPPFGLVLAGGGARGAYQAGVLQYMAEIDLSPNIIAGTSIGALNGAVLASSESFKQGVKRIVELWEKLGETKILRPNTNSASLFDPEPIANLLREAVDPTQLRKGTELWVAAFPSSFKNINIDYGLITSFLIDIVSSKTGTDAHYFRVQDCQDNETIYNLLLASASIPLAFPAREINGQFYVDGFLGDNVPLRAFAERGCTHAFVIHLENGSVWNRYDFPEKLIIEIRPQERINPTDTPILSELVTAFDFSSDKINTLKTRGYNDAECCLNKVSDVQLSIRKQRDIQIQLGEELCEQE